MLSKLNLRGIATILCLTCLLLFSRAFAQSSATIPGDFPDPTVIQANGEYFAVGTSSEWAPHLPIYSSKNMHDWVQTGFVFSTTPDWAESSFWAPEYFYHEGLYYIYYSAKRKGDGVSCIGVATSRFPDRDFVDHGIVVDYGSESIDAYVVKEGDELYMTWKAYGLDDRPIELLGSKMSKDGMSLVGEPFTLIKDTQGIGVEGQSFVKKDGYYYMFYSAGNCCGPGCNYRVYASRSKSLFEPFTNVSEAVLLGENNLWKCMGHGTFINGPQDELYYLYHGYSKESSIYTGREGLLAELVWSDKGDPVFEFVANSKEANKNLSIDFSKSKEQLWQWDFKNSKPSWKFTPKGVRLSGELPSTNQTGVVLTWRPNTGQYSVKSTILLDKNNAQALKGLAVYGDKDRAVGVGVQANQIKVWQTNDQGFQELKSVELPKDLKKLELQLVVHSDQSCKIYYKNIDKWIAIELEGDGLSVKDLAPWDRSPRPGIHFKGKKDQFATFANFSMENVIE